MNTYLQKYRFVPRQLAEAPDQGTAVIAVIPYHQGKPPIALLEDLAYGMHPGCMVEALIVAYGSSENHPQGQTMQTEAIETLEQWIKACESDFLRCKLIKQLRLPVRQRGPGLARKIGMDEAVDRFEQVRGGPQVIASLDPSARVEANYLLELNRHFKEHPKTPGCSVRFELTDEEGKQDDKAVALYELHLRYVQLGLRWAGSPHAFHGLGSAMAFRSAAYQKQGGMNMRKEEDMEHLLRQLVALGGYTRLQNTRVFPPVDLRKRSISSATEPQYFTYHPQTFVYLKGLIQALPEFYFSHFSLHHMNHLFPPILIDFLHGYFFDERIREIKANSHNINSFQKRFFNWFHAGITRRFMDYVSDNAHPKIKVQRACAQLNKKYKWKYAERIGSELELLSFYRRMEMELA